MTGIGMERRSSMARHQSEHARSEEAAIQLVLQAQPFAMPEHLEHELAEVLAYWEGLEHRHDDVPYWDEVHLTSIREYNNILMMIEVFENPERFRFGVAGRAIVQRFGKSLEGHFVDEVARRAPVEYLASQCSATVQSERPTFYHHVAMNTHAPDPSKSYLRLLLPLWGDSRVDMLLGAIVMAD
jgi:hypothetical protein